jgi:hypothetical protein
MCISKSLSLLMLVILAVTSSCEDSMLQKSQGPIGGKTTDGDGRNHPDDKATPDGGYPYPKIIEKEYIPSYDDFADTKCYAWRITWPEYADDVDQDMIPTVFSTSNGELNSFHFLNNTSSSNTYNGHFSLYYGNKIEAANVMWDELDYSFGGFSQMKPVCFGESTFTLAHIIDWTTERPSLFESNWPGTCDVELEYAKGNIFHFMITDGDVDRFGGIRIVSMTPRIIEVYLAVPNL